MRRIIRAAAIIALTACVAGPAFAGEPQQRRRAATDRHAQAFKKLDKDGNGSISREEWTRKPKAFDRLDVNKDGRLTPAELQQVRARRARRVS
jgi:Ca2+-binding EF-hand superfamily protein